MKIILDPIFSLVPVFSKKKNSEKNIQYDFCFEIDRGRGNINLGLSETDDCGACVKIKRFEATLFFYTKI
jgi:hypothetical protein